MRIDRDVLLLSPPPSVTPNFLEEFGYLPCPKELLLLMVMKKLPGRKMVNG
jgi:hypothetical protein